jgi:8-hydroxy-5-deazaflavin:NADPH oxidoreductase
MTEPGSGPPVSPTVAAVRGLIVGVLGGTGDQGRGLAYRFGRAGLNVLIGSRDAARAAAAAADIGAGVRGVTNQECAVGADVVIVAVPWDGHAALLESLREVLVGKIVVDCVNPIGFDGKGAFALPVAEGSALQQAVGLLPDSRVVGAFHHISAKVLEDVEVDSVDCDVLVLGDDREATDLVQALASVIPGVRGIYGGRVRNAHQVEALTANLVAVNRRYRTHAGVRLTGV